MRIVAGRFRGRTLKAPADRAIRPSSDRLREALFDILAHAYDAPAQGARVLDLFAGTGALGLEAISRGAAFCLFVDEGAAARALIRDNVEALGLGGTTKLFRRDATRLGPCPAAPFDLAFLDPPYRQDLAAPALVAAATGNWLTLGSMAVVEEAADAAFVAPAGFEMVDERRVGESRLAFLRYGP